MNSLLKRSESHPYEEIKKELKQRQLKYLRQRQSVLNIWKRGESKPGPVV